MNTVNIFKPYQQLENHFTNGLMSILSLSQLESPSFVASFLHEVLGLPPDGEIDTFRVLPPKDGTPDGELSGKECCIWLESKITSESLDEVQIRQHLDGVKGDDSRQGLKRRAEKLKRLVLLTPDESCSRYVKHFVEIDAACILHLEWKHVYTYLERFVNEPKPSIFSVMVRQFLTQIHEMVFTQDIAGVIFKIAFNDDTEVSPDKYLGEMKEGKWTRWNTRNKCKSLGETGRKLMLYDTNKKAITVEVVIKSVTENGPEPDYAWNYEFAEGTLHVFDCPIVLSEIEQVLNTFNKSQSPFRNITHEQYRQLMGQRSDTTNGGTIGCS